MSSAAETKETDCLRFIASCFDWYENNRPDSYACHIRADIFCLCTSYEEVEELEIIVRGDQKKDN